MERILTPNFLFFLSISLISSKGKRKAIRGDERNGWERGQGGDGSHGDKTKDL